MSVQRIHRLQVSCQFYCVNYACNHHTRQVCREPACLRWSSTCTTTSHQSVRDVQEDLHISTVVSPLFRGITSRARAGVRGADARPAGELIFVFRHCVLDIGRLFRSRYLTGSSIQHSEPEISNSLVSTRASLKIKIAFYTKH